MDYSQIPAFCVNLAARADRWSQAQIEFARIAYPVTRWFAAHYAQSPYPGLSTGAAGCLDSHKALWRHCLNENLDMIAVFEDDVVFSSDFAAVFPLAAAELPEDWDVWHLHSSKVPQSGAGKYLVRARNKLWGTHGYLIRRRGCERALALPDDVPADYRLSEYLDQRGGQVYATRQEHALAFQQGDDSDIPRTAQLEFWREQRQRFCR